MGCTDYDPALVSLRRPRRAVSVTQASRRRLAPALAAMAAGLASLTGSVAPVGLKLTPVSHVVAADTSASAAMVLPESILAAPTRLPPLPVRPADISNLLSKLLGGGFGSPVLPSPAPAPTPIPTPNQPSPFDPFNTPPPPPVQSRPAPAQSELEAPAVVGPGASTVKVSGLACGFRLNGSGFSPARDLVLTNAHVVAGVREPVVTRSDGTTLAAQVVMFDPNRDVAVLAVKDLDEPSLALGTAVIPSSATVYGHPLGQEELRALPVQIDARQVAQVPNIYVNASAPRSILVMRGDVRLGDSGAPTVDESGRAVGMVFAIESQRPGRAFAIPSEDLASAVAAPRIANGNTGPCLR